MTTYSAIGIFLGVFWLAILPASRALAETSHRAPSTELLAREAGERIARVPEFIFLREEAKKMGVRVYLFGGTAASYAHYVKQDLMREAGDSTYPPHLYDYDYTNIFRSTQDLDVVIDGSAAQAEALEAALKEKFPHFIGDKGAKWELRPLRTARGDKEAILDSPSFQNQNSDSHSTGLVEVTETPKGESPIRDVRDWQNQAPQFLRDVQEGKIHYYHSPLHGTTARAKNGLNPEILSVIRYLTKAFQYDLAMRPEDQAKIRKIVKAFTPEDLSNDYVKDWMEKNGKKLYQHSVNLDFSSQTLDDLGLKKKLIALKGDTDVEDSLAWWMNRKPLLLRPLGEKPGRTAAEIAKTLPKEMLSADGRILVSHETRSFLAFESITRDKAGDLNAFTSRESATGEMAAYGEGFYTRLGRKGAVGNGITIRMELDPKAVEGVDFERHSDIILLKNKAAVRVIPEELDLSLEEYFRLLKQDRDFNADNKALVEKFVRKAGRKGIADEADLKAAFKIVRETLGDRFVKPDDVVLTEWMKVQAVNKKFSLGTDDFLRLLRMEPNSYGAGKEVVRAALAQFATESSPERQRAIWQLVNEKMDRSERSDNEFAKEIIEAWLKSPLAEKSEEFLVSLDREIQAALSAPGEMGFRRNGRFVETLHYLSYKNKALGPEGRGHIQRLIELGKGPEGAKAREILAKYVLSPGSDSVFREFPEAIELMRAYPENARQMLKQHMFFSGQIPKWRNGIEPDLAWLSSPQGTEMLLKNLPEMATATQGVESIMGYLANPRWVSSPRSAEIFRALKDASAKVEMDRTSFLYKIQESNWVNHPEFKNAVYEALADPATTIGFQAVLTHRSVTNQPEWPDYIRKFMRSPVDNINFPFFSTIFAQPHTIAHPEFKTLFREFIALKKHEPKFLNEVMSYFASYQTLNKNPLAVDLLKIAIEEMDIDESLLKEWARNQKQLNEVKIKSGRMAPDAKTDGAIDLVKRALSTRPNSPSCGESFRQLGN